MTLDEAIKKATSPMQPANNINNNPDPYAIPFELANTARDLVGSTFRSKDPKNTNVIEVIKWVGQNYVLRVNGKEDNYQVSPVMWTLQNLDRLEIVR